MSDLPMRATLASRFYRRELARQRHISRVLQNAIQPAAGMVGEIGEMRVAARCRGADRALRIGGDWYFAVPLENGDVVLGVGDVVGHGLDAVAAMVGLRYATMAYAAEGIPPALILSRLNYLAYGTRGDITATAVVAKYRPSLGRLTWARAGHPPMLLADHRRVVRLPNPRGPLLGTLADPPFAQESRQLQPGQSVVLYTDGLLGRGLLDRGVDQLADRIAGLSDVAAMLDALDVSATGDDMCVLLAQRAT
jgi:serine phosphatase RsbU (regulator of sigma subunit)